MTFWETVEGGEYVMIALAVLLIVCICIWWIQASRLERQKKGYTSLIQRVRDLVTEGDIDNAMQICTVSYNPAARVMASALKIVGQPMEDVKSAMRDTSVIEKNKMGKGTMWLKWIAIVTPLSGLGGTLVGIIDRLRDLGESGELVTISQVCASLSPTIVTTVSGLGVGIFALLALTALESKIYSSRRSLDELALDFTNLLNSPF